VAPGADPKAIALEIETGNSKLEIGNSKIENGEASSASPESRVPSPGGVRIDANGDLVISTDAGEVRFRKPLVYQPQAGVGSRQSAVITDDGPGTTDAAPAANPKSKIPNPKFVEGSYKLIAKNQVAIEVASYDKTLPLIIDPVLVYSAQLSLGTSTRMAVDSSGSVYLAGSTASTDFPATPGAYQTACVPDTIGFHFCHDAFVLKLNSDGSALVYATFLGGSNSDSAAGIAVDASGNAYLAGNTSSADFPTTPGAFQTSCSETSSCYDLFVTKLSPDGSALVYSTFLGGTSVEGGSRIALDSAGNAYIAGRTQSANFPTVNALQPTYGGGQDAFLSKLNAAGTALVYSTYLGGSDQDGVNALAVDAQGNAYVTGTASSLEIYCIPLYQWCNLVYPWDYSCCDTSVQFPVHFPTTPGALRSSCSVSFNGSGPCNFLAKISAVGSQLVYSTFMPSPIYGRPIAADPAGNAYLSGGNSVYKLDPAGSTLVYQFEFPLVRSDGIWVTGIALDATGNVYVAGTVYARDFPTVNAIQPTMRDPEISGQNPTDAFVAKLDPESSTLLFSTFFGGEGRDNGSDLAIDGSGNIYLTGTLDRYRYSYDFPTTSGSFNSLPPAYFFVAKIAPEDAPGVAVTPVALRLPSVLNPYSPGPPKVTVTVRNMGTAPLTITDIAVTGAFVASSLDCLASLAAGAACTINVAYASDAPFAEELTGTLSITDNAADSPQIVPLSGDRQHGPNPTLSAGQLEFRQDVGTASPPQTLTLGNSSVVNNDPLEIYGIAVTGEFSQTNNCPLAPNLLAAGESCTISVVFTPTLMGQRPGLLTITNNSSPGPNLTIGLDGTGLQVRASLSLQSWTFPTNQLVGTTSAPEWIDLRNTGNAPLTITSITATGDYALTHNCVSPVSPADYCRIRVTFTPTVPGTATGAITITDNAPDSPQIISLTGTGAVATLALSTTRLDFGNQPLGTTSAAQAVTLTNAGVAPVNIAGITTSGDFAQTNDCGSSVGVAGTCTISVTFTPTVGGGRSGTLIIADDAARGPHRIDLHGHGTHPDVTFSGNHLEFGNQSVGTTSAARTVTLTNIGSAPLNILAIATSGDFASSNACPTSLAPSGSCTISVTFTPTAPYTRTGTLTITDNAPGSPHVVTLSGTGVGPAVSLFPTGLRLADQPLGTTSAPQAVALTNVGNAPMTISGITTSGAYAQSNNCVSPLAPEASCTINVTFTPTVVGGQSGTLIITSNAFGSPHTVGLNGIGLGPVATLSTANLDFSNQPLGIASAPRLVNLSNSGNAALTITSIVASGDFAQTNNCPSSLAARNYCTISVTFTPPPAVAGGQSGTLTIADDASDSPHVVNLLGTGIGPVASLSTNTLSFAGQIVGTTSPVEAVTLTNSGNAPLAISSITATGDYALTHNCVSPLAAEASCTLSVTFTPTDAGGRAGTLIITDDAAGSPRTVSLSGIGQDFSLGAFTTARAVSPGMTARFDLLLMPQGGFQQTVSLACSGAPAGATCSVRPSSVTPNGVNNVSVALEVVTTAPAASAPRDGGGRRSLPPGGWPVAMTVALLGALALLAGAILRRAASSARLRLLPVLGACLLLVALVWAACGGGGLYVRSGGTPAGTYMLTITATASDLSHSTTVELTVR